MSSAERSIRIKRAYDPPAPSDGRRFLVDRVWPRGVTKETLGIEAWLKQAAPSSELRKWFGHDPARWDEFRRRYREELEHNPEAWKPLLSAVNSGSITIVYSAKDTEHNNAVALKEFLESKL